MAKACDHGGDGLPLFHPLAPPRELTFRCERCGALAYMRRKGLGGGRHFRGKLVFYRCRIVGCLGVVIERSYGTKNSMELQCGCAKHPVP